MQILAIPTINPQVSEVRRRLGLNRGPRQVRVLLVGAELNRVGDVKMGDEDLPNLALALLECWRRHLLSVRDDDHDDEGLSDYIDLVFHFGRNVECLSEHNDEELASAIRLIFELDGMMHIGLGDTEHRMVIDFHSAAMMSLANLMRTRGHRCSLPNVKLS